MRLVYELTDETKEVMGRTVHRIVATDGNWYCAPGTLGGWIESERNLSDFAWVADEACVFDNACVYGTAILFDKAMVYENGQVYDNARLFNQAMVYGEACVYGESVLHDEARVYDEARVFGNARISYNARVYGKAQAFEQCNVFESSRLYGDAKLHGDGFLRDADLHGGDWSDMPYFAGLSVFNLCVTSPDSVKIGCQDHTFERWHNRWRAIAYKSAPLINFVKSDYIVVDLVKHFNKACDITGNSEYKLDLESVRAELRKPRYAKLKE